MAGRQGPRRAWGAYAARHLLTVDTRTVRANTGAGLKENAMASTVTPQTLYADRLQSALGTLLLIHDRKGHMRALDFHDFESRMRRLLRLHYGGQGNDFAIEDRTRGDAEKTWRSLP